MVSPFLRINVAHLEGFVKRAGLRGRGRSYAHRLSFGEREGVEDMRVCVLRLA